MEQNPKISIIVPAYNVEKYISQCLDSLVNQTYKNIEIIVINDGSSDNTFSTIKKYAENDNRVIAINQANKGVSASRNIGLEKLTGEYVTFVDSDDWIELDACEKMLEHVINNNADIGIFSYIREYDNNSLPKSVFEKDEIIFEGEEIKNKLHRRIYGPIGEEISHPEKLNAIVTLWGKIYKSEIIKNIKFYSLEELGLCEDGYFNISAFNKATKVIYKNKYFYHYRKVVLGGSLTQKKNDDFFEKEKTFLKRLSSDIDKNELSEDYRIALQNRTTISLIECGISIVNNKKDIFKKTKEILQSEIYREACKKFELKYLPLHWKIFFLCAKFKFTLGVVVLLKVIVKLSNRK